MTVVGVAFCACVGCNKPQPVEPVFWSGADDRPALESSFFLEHDLQDLSLYAQFESGPDRPDAAHRGPLAVGNGRAFAMLGLADPLNRLHNAVGPTYSKGGRFFGDHWLTLVVDGQELPFDKEWIARPRGTGLVVTRADAGDVSLYTVDASIRHDGQAVPGILRWIIVRSASSHSVDLRLHAVHDLVDATEITAKGRRMAWIGWDDAPQDELVRLGTVEAGGEARTALVAAMGHSEQDIEAVQALLDGADPGDLLDETVSWWREFSSKGMQLSTDDARVHDLYDGMRVGLEVQRTHGGGVSPMSRYTGVWLRDTIGPTRFLLRSGRPDLARTGLDYLYACHVEGGDFGNACSSEIDPEQVGEAPDWDAMQPFGGRTGAEGPSYVPLAYRDFARWTADESLTRARWPYLRRALVAQQMDDQGRQGWSGDETFRLVMGASLGYPLEYAWPELSYSSNSSFLMVAASDYMASASTESVDRERFEELAERARGGLRDHFLIDGSHYAPFIFHTAGSDNEANYVEQRPFEDANLKGLWSGALAYDDPTALSDLQNLLDVAGRGDGTIQSAIDPGYSNVIGITVYDGVATGMVPGYTLTALTLTGDPLAQGAFNALHRYAGPTGQYPEDLLYDDMSALQVVYDERGGLGDIAARYRPWEGGVNLDAMLSYLVGAEPIEGGMRLRPHLPNQQAHLQAAQVQAGVGLGTLVVERTPERLTATFASEADTPFDLVIELPEPIGFIGESDEVVVLPRGERLHRRVFAGLAPGESVELSVELEGLRE